MIRWTLSPHVAMRNPRVVDDDADRQQETAAEILSRFQRQPGLILADEVGMGKTFVALAVAVSALHASGRRNPVVIMVPPGVQEKWPRDWRVFQENCLNGGPEIRTTEHTVNTPSDFLKLLDDPPSRRCHIIFLTHGALTNGLTDPYVRLAIIRAALRRRSLKTQRDVFPKWANRIIPGLSLPPELTDELLSARVDRWRSVCARHGRELDDDPVPAALRPAIRGSNLADLVHALKDLPLRSSKHVDRHLALVRSALLAGVRDVWQDCMQNIAVHLPLLVFDEAHHAKNPRTRLASLFASPKAVEDAEEVRGALGGVFDRMLFLTATPFQLSHHELIEVLRRFDGVRWDGLDPHIYERQLDELEESLNVAQGAALRLDRAWTKLEGIELPDEATGWWAAPEETLDRPIARVTALISETQRKVRDAEGLLRPHVIRHGRPNQALRRELRCGRRIVRPEGPASGLVVGGPAILPFLLAARTQAIVAAEDHRLARSHRAFFAEGLASSFEAYRKTRSRNDPEEFLDEDSVVGADSSGSGLSDAAQWYLRELDRALPTSAEGRWAEHPKIAATVNRVLELWDDGEKALVFCFYIETGRALRAHISQALRRRIADRAVHQLGPDEAAALRELELVGDLLNDPKSPAFKAASSALTEIFIEAGLVGTDLDACVDVGRRFMRTPSFLIRFADLKAGERGDAWVGRALAGADGSGESLDQKLKAFGAFVADRVDRERTAVLDAVGLIRTGEIRDESEGPAGSAVPNVRLANGGVRRETRERLMHAFNTPFFPEILVASSVMAEGVDLQLECRNVIHHDLDWNPSVIEQRTGRLDRIGSKAERTQTPIHVYEPYLEGTQDEKQFRVMKDRERWFNVVMGERLELDEWSTDQLADRPELPEAVARMLTMDLAVVR